jgi:DNA-binding NtrC family response regulator
VAHLPVANHKVQMSGGSNNKKPTVLLVDDQYRSFRPLSHCISPQEFSSLWVADEQEGLNLLKKQPHKKWIIVVDLKSTGMGGGGFLHLARQIAPEAAVLVTSPLGPFLYQGGSFYQYCGPTLKQEINAILRGIAQNPSRTAPDQTAPGTGNQPGNREALFDAIIGNSASLQSILAMIRDLQDSPITVLIQGESGTGKELIARAIHLTSRPKGPFVAVNCGAIPTYLMESELFGHERGAFTGAFSQKKGKFEISQDGTLLLDEIGELDKDLQVKLLRVLQEKEFQRVGGNKTYHTNARIIAATSRDMKNSVKRGAFREDLYYRLNVLPLHIPPLRERAEDIPLLLEHFFRKRSLDATNGSVPAISSEAWEALLHYHYPGNIRELANLVERLTVICRGGQITVADLPREMLGGTEPAAESPGHLKELPKEGVSLREVERELILKTLRKTSGNKLAAAKMLGITRRLLYLRLADIDPNEPL